MFTTLHKETLRWSSHFYLSSNYGVEPRGAVVGVVFLLCFSVLSFFCYFLAEYFTLIQQELTGEKKELKGKPFAYHFKKKKENFIFVKYRYVNEESGSLFA